MSLLAPYIKERNNKKDESYIPPCDVFGGILRSFVAFGVVSVAPRTGWCVKPATGRPYVRAFSLSGTVCAFTR